MVSKKDGIAMLRGVPMFTDVSQKDLGKVWSHVKVVDHAAGSKIVSEARGGAGFHLILAGEVEVSRRGKKVTLGVGQFFGEISLIDDGPRTATVTAVTSVQVATISAWEFKSVVKSTPDMMWKLLLHMTARLREEQSVVASLTA